MRIDTTLFFAGFTAYVPRSWNSLWTSPLRFSSYCRHIYLGNRFLLIICDSAQDLVDFGFSFEKQMKDENKVHLAAENGRLKISTSATAFGFMIKKELHVDRPNLLEIDTGELSLGERSSAFIKNISLGRAD